MADNWDQHELNDSRLKLSLKVAGERSTQMKFKNH